MRKNEKERTKVMKEEKETKLVAKSSKAFNYNYTSLADIYKAGHKIPKMRVARIEGNDYIEYLDENGEWQLGARVVIPVMRGANEAQAYGSALTYARRYTAQLALALVSDDDQKIETQAPENSKSQKSNQQAKPTNNYRLDFDEVREKLKTLSTLVELSKYYTELTTENKMSDKQKTAVKNMFTARKKELGLTE